MDPRYPIGKYEMPAQITPELRAGAILEIASTPGKVRAAVNGLSDAQLAEVEGLLLQGATAHGWANALWTAKRVAEVIRRHFDVSFHPEHVRKILKYRLH